MRHGATQIYIWIYYFCLYLTRMQYIMLGKVLQVPEDMGLLRKVFVSSYLCVVFLLFWGHPTAFCPLVVKKSLRSLALLFSEFNPMPTHTAR